MRLNNQSSLQSMKPHESNTHTLNVLFVVKSTLNVLFVVKSRITNPYAHLMHLMLLNNHL